MPTAKLPTDFPRPLLDLLYTACLNGHASLPLPSTTAARTTRYRAYSLVSAICRANLPWAPYARRLAFSTQPDHLTNTSTLHAYLPEFDPSLPAPESSQLLATYKPTTPPDPLSTTPPAETPTIPAPLPPDSQDSQDTYDQALRSLGYLPPSP